MLLPKAFQAKIIQRFLDDAEFQQFLDDYTQARFRDPAWHWVPTEKDWATFRNLKDWTDIREVIETLQKKWGVKDKTTVIRRLGMLALLEKQKK